MDRIDAVTLLGVLLLGAALYLWLGLAALLGYAGVVLLILGGAAAYKQRQPGDVSPETKAEKKP